MNHEQIDQFDFIDRYLMGKLPAAESTDFEEHFLDCPQCIDRLQTTRGFLQGLRLVAADQASQTDYQQPKRQFVYLPKTFLRNPRVWAVVCLLIAAAAGAIFFVGYTRRLQAAVNQAESRSEQWQRRYEDERQAAISAERKHQETELQRAEALSALETKLKDEEAQRAKMAADIKQRMSTTGDVLSFTLISVRGGKSSATESVNDILLPRSATMLIFSISLEEEKRFENYHITIFDEHRRTIWKNRSLTPNQNDIFSIPLPSSLFRPGHFSLIVKGVKKGSEEEIGNYPFRIRKAR
jgi:hypothetical protein